jgi:hypothetical protein
MRRAWAPVVCQESDESPGRNASNLRLAGEAGADRALQHVSRIVCGARALAPVAAVIVFIRRSRPIGAAAQVMNLVVALFLTTYCSSPLPEPAPFDGPLPPARRSRATIVV